MWTLRVCICRLNHWPLASVVLYWRLDGDRMRPVDEDLRKPVDENTVWHCSLIKAPWKPGEQLLKHTCYCWACCRDIHSRSLTKATLLKQICRWKTLIKSCTKEGFSKPGTDFTYREMINKPVDGVGHNCSLPLWRVHEIKCAYLASRIHGLFIT